MLLLATSSANIAVPAVQLAPTLEAFKLVEAGEAVVTTSSGPGGTSDPALQINTTAAVAQPYMLALGAPALDTVSKDDVLYLTFQARAMAPADAHVGVALQGPAPGYQKAVDVSFMLNSSWQNFSIAVANEALVGASAPGVMQIFVGYQLQTIEIASLSLLNYKGTKTPADFPTCCFNYPGREESAAWRGPAADRIVKLRKAPLQVTVVDKSTATPISGASVVSNMTRHLFRHGSCLPTAMVLQQDDDGDTYRQHALELFNHVGFCNGFKWPAWEIPSERNDTLKALRWVAAHNFSVRGHNLVWPGCSSGLLPPDVCGLESNPAALQTRILTHITDEVTTLQKMFPGLIEEWDVVNEPVEQHDLMDVLGGEWAVASWLNATAVANPAAGRRLNDNGVCSAGAVGGGQE